MASQLKEERRKTADLRFYKFHVRGPNAWPWLICDSDSEPKSFAKFKSECDADVFLEVVRARYVCEENKT